MKEKEEVGVKVKVKGEKDMNEGEREGSEGYFVASAEETG